MSQISPTLIDREPVAVFVGGLAGVVSTGIGLAAVLDWVALTDGQAQAIAGFVTLAAGFVIAALRARVWSPAAADAAGLR